MNLTLEITKSDHLYLNNFVAFKKDRKRILVILGVISILLLGIDMMTIQIKGQNPQSIRYVISLVAPLVWWYLFLFFAIRHSVKKLLEKSPNLLGETLLNLNEDSLILTRGDSNGSFPWRILVEIIETESHFLLFNTTQSAVIIPKRCVDRNEVRTLLQEKAEKWNIPSTFLEAPNSTWTS